MCSSDLSFKSTVGNEETLAHIQQTIMNVETFSKELKQIFVASHDDDIQDSPAKHFLRSSTNIMKTLNSLEVNTGASIRHSTKSKDTFYAAGLDFRLGKYFIRTGFGDRLGSTQLLHFQHGIRFSNMMTGRFGLFYKKPGLGLDIIFTPRTMLTLELYNLDAIEVDLITRYALRDDMDIL